MFKFIGIFATTLALAPVAMATVKPDTHPTTGYVCTPHGVARGWAIQYNPTTGAADHFVKLGKGVRFAKNLCIEYRDGSPVRFVEYRPQG